MTKVNIVKDCVFERSGKVTCECSIDKFNNLENIVHSEQSLRIKDSHNEKYSFFKLVRRKVHFGDYYSDEQTMRESACAKNVYTCYKAGWLMSGIR